MHAFTSYNWCLMIEWWVIESWQLVKSDCWAAFWCFWMKVIQVGIILDIVGGAYWSGQTWPWNKRRETESKITFTSRWQYTARTVNEAEGGRSDASAGENQSAGKRNINICVLKALMSPKRQQAHDIRHKGPTVTYKNTCRHKKMRFTLGADHLISQPRLRPFPLIFPEAEEWLGGKMEYWCWSNFVSCFAE